MHQGQLVTYVGGGDKGPLNSVGQIIDLDDSSRSAHVMWKTGPSTGSIGLYAYEDLSDHQVHEASFQQSLDDSLDYGEMDDGDSSVSISLDHSLDYETRDLLGEAVYEAGQKAWLSALDVFSNSLYANTMDTTGHDHHSIMCKTYALKAMKDFIKRAEEQ